MQVGDYVRTKSGFIDKIININDFREPSVKYALEQPSWNDDVVFVGDEDISKSSPNIMDLIEVGDYVNGLKVSGVGGTYHGRKDKAIYCDYCVDKETGKWTMIYDDEIKSIVTKEQFEAMEYKVGVDKE